MAHAGISALVAIAAAGCTAGRQPGAPATPSAPATRICPTSERAPSDAQTGQAPDDPRAPVSFGQPSSTVGSGFDVEFTVFDYKQPAGSACPNPDHPDHEWAAVDVQACAKALPAGFAFTLAWTTWSLAFADRTTADIAPIDLPGFEQPRYPDHQVLTVGQCRRGWITMSVPKGKRPVTVLYQPVDEVHAWTVPPQS
jgi:hypothetical protein